MDGGLSQVLAAFAGRRILIAGDLMLDEYVWGRVRRISPEAPVPVVEVERRSCMPGGAGNAAANVSSLGGKVTLLGIVGTDDSGARLREALVTAGVDVGALLVDAARPTTGKLRVVAHSQHVVRVDEEQRQPLALEQEDQLLARAADILPGVDAVLLSDYLKGVVSSRFAQGLIRLARGADKPIVVDPKGTVYDKYRHATVLKPNLREAGEALHRELESLTDLLDAGRQLLELQQSDAVLITRGAEGMSLFVRDQEPVHIPTAAQEIYDVTGAGDTVAGTMVLSLAAGGTMEQSARLANQAAAIVVGKVGTAPAHLEELEARIASTN
jgi:D-beta-D-heptose 7-phosphate kinase/D-beta-D-heptose 1-phosphate adenosyltransferase